MTEENVQGTSTGDADIDAGLARLEVTAGVGDPAAAPGAVVPVVDPDAWRTTWLPYVSQGGGMVEKWATNWNWDPEMKLMAQEAIAQILEDFMPGGIAGIERWGKYAKLAFSVGCLVFLNWDPETKKIKPPRLPAPPKKEPIEGEAQPV